MLTVLVAIANIALSAQVARESYHGGPLGIPRATISDERATQMLDPMQADLTRLTGKQTNLRSVTIFNERGRPGSTFCGTVSYDGGPWISFVMRSPPRPLIEPAITVFEPAELEIWRRAGCHQDGGVHVERS